MAIEDLADKVLDIGRRRGFFWPAFEIYGGVAGFYDLGPYGALLKQNIIEEWRRHFIKRYPDLIVEIETPVITPEKVFIASGHVENFVDPIVGCKKCGRFFRADQLIEEKLGVKAEGKSVEELTDIIYKSGLRCPVCGGELGEVRLFNLLFRTQIGPYQGSVGFFRPEAAQGMFISFKRVHQVMRNKLPIGIAQIGRVARNEISPRQGLIRLREFTIMEFEFFFDQNEPGADEYIDKVRNEKLPLITANMRREKIEEPQSFTIDEALMQGVIKTPWMAFWMYESMLFLEKIGVPRTNVAFEEKLPEERAHYSRQTFDQLVKTARWGWIEVAGHAYRGDYDLSRHMQFSGEDLTVRKQLREPVERRTLVVRLNKAALGRELKDKLDSIQQQIKSMSPEVLKRELDEKGFIEVSGVRLSRNHLIIEEVVEKVATISVTPHVVEPSFGSERLLYVAMEYALREKQGRLILSFPRRIAPVKVAVFPLVDNEKIVGMAKRIYDMLKETDLMVTYDDSGSIGRRYARADEVGVPVCVTIDYQSLTDGTVTLRDRDSWKQVRVHVDKLVESLRRFIYDNVEIEELGPIFFSEEKE